MFFCVLFLSKWGWKWTNIFVRFENEIKSKVASRSYNLATALKDEASAAYWYLPNEWMREKQSFGCSAVRIFNNSSGVRAGSEAEKGAVFHRRRQGGRIFVLGKRRAFFFFPVEDDAMDNWCWSSLVGYNNSTFTDEEKEEAVVMNAFSNASLRLFLHPFFGRGVEWMSGCGVAGWGKTYLVNFWTLTFSFYVSTWWTDARHSEGSRKRSKWERKNNRTKEMQKKMNWYIVYFVYVLKQEFPFIIIFCLLIPSVNFSYARYFAFANARWRCFLNDWSICKYRRMRMSI